MSEQNVPTPSVTDDEISLLDLFLVLIRHRRVVLLITLLSVLGAAGYYFRPLLGFGSAGLNAAYEAQVRYTFPLIPQTVENYFRADIPSLLQNQARDPQIIAPLYRQHFQPSTPLGPGVYAFVRDNVVGKSYQITPLTLPTTATVANARPSSPSQITLQISGPSSQEVQGFLESLDQALLDNLGAQLVYELDTTLASLRTILSDTSGIGTTTTAEQWFAFLQLQNLESGPGFPWKKSEILVFEQSQTGGSSAMIPVVIVFGGVFFAIFLAFILEYFRTLRNSPEDMEKIRQALK